MDVGLLSSRSGERSPSLKPCARQSGRFDCGASQHVMFWLCRCVTESGAGVAGVSSVEVINPGFALLEDRTLVLNMGFCELCGVPSGAIRGVVWHRLRLNW